MTQRAKPRRPASLSCMPLQSANHQLGIRQRPFKRTCGMSGRGCWHFLAFPGSYLPTAATWTNCTNHRKKRHATWVKYHTMPPPDIHSSRIMMPMAYVWSLTGALDLSSSWRPVKSRPLSSDCFLSSSTAQNKPQVCPIFSAPSCQMFHSCSPPRKREEEQRGNGYACACHPSLLPPYQQSQGPCRSILPCVCVCVCTASVMLCDLPCGFSGSGFSCGRNSAAFPGLCLCRLFL